MSKELIFASENEAVQHLSNLTGKKIIIAGKVPDGWIDVKDGAVGGFVYTYGAPDQWAKGQGATHTIYLEGTVNESGKRGAIIKKTSARVIVDEDDAGKAVWETWQLKKNRDYNEDNIPDHKRMQISKPHHTEEYKKMVIEESE